MQRDNDDSYDERFMWRVFYFLLLCIAAMLIGASVSDAQTIDFAQIESIEPPGYGEPPPETAANISFTDWYDFARFHVFANKISDQKDLYSINCEGASPGVAGCFLFVWRSRCEPHPTTGLVTCIPKIDYTLFIAREGLDRIRLATQLALDTIDEGPPPGGPVPVECDDPVPAEPAPCTNSIFAANPC